VPTYRGGDETVRWTALLEVRFRGASPGWDFTIVGTREIRGDVEKLSNLRAFADHVGVIVVEELPSLADEDLADLTAEDPDVALYFASLQIAA
jgi:hypothetical protein